MDTCTDKGDFASSSIDNQKEGSVNRDSPSIGQKRTRNYFSNNDDRAALEMALKEVNARNEDTTPFTHALVVSAASHNIPQSTLYNYAKNIEKMGNLRGKGRPKIVDDDTLKRLVEQFATTSYTPKEAKIAIEKETGLDPSKVKNFLRTFNNQVKKYREESVMHPKLPDKGSVDDNLLMIKEGAKEEDPSSRGVGVDIRVSVDGAEGKGGGTMEATTAAQDEVVEYSPPVGDTTIVEGSSNSVTNMGADCVVCIVCNTELNKVNASYNQRKKMEPKCKHCTQNWEDAKTKRSMYYVRTIEKDKLLGGQVTFQTLLQNLINLYNNNMHISCPGQSDLQKLHNLGEKLHNSDHNCVTQNDGKMFVHSERFGIFQKLSGIIKGEKRGKVAASEYLFSFPLRDKTIYADFLSNWTFHSHRHIGEPSRVRLLSSLHSWQN